MFSSIDQGRYNQKLACIILSACYHLNQLMLVRMGMPEVCYETLECFTIVPGFNFKEKYSKALCGIGKRTDEGGKRERERESSVQ